MKKIYTITETTMPNGEVVLTRENSGWQVMELLGVLTLVTFEIRDMIHGVEYDKIERVIIKENP